MDTTDTREERATQLLAEALRRGVVLAVVAIPLLAACWRVSGHRPLGTFSFGIYLAAAGLLVLCEQWLPYDREWGSALRGGKTDFAYVILATAMDKVMFFVCVTTAATVGRTLADHFAINLWPGDWSLGLQIVAALVVADVATYVRHRLSHWSDVLWRFHQIHHSMTGLYWIRSAYTHPFEQLLILTAIMLPIALLGAGDQVIAAVAFLFGLSGLVQHANVDARSSALNYVFATPETHRVHHGIDDGDSNFSAFFVVMDLLCGTYRTPTRSANRIRVGLRGEPSFPGDFLSHLTLPFRRDPGPDPVVMANEPWSGSDRTDVRNA